MSEKGPTTFESCASVNPNFQTPKSLKKKFQNLDIEKFLNSEHQYGDVSSVALLTFDIDSISFWNMEKDYETALFHFHGRGSYYL